MLKIRLSIFVLTAIGVAAAASSYRKWAVYGGGNDDIRYSDLSQINRSNVSKLQVAWIYDRGDAFKNSEMECNPLVVGDTLYATTPKLRLIALDAATGELRWRFDPHAGRDYIHKSRNRGLNYWTDGKATRVYYGVENWLYAIDAKTGKPAAGFGVEGRIDLRENLGRDPEAQNISLNSPGVIYKNLLIIGSVTAEDLPASPGDIRAYDVVSARR